MKWLLCVRTPRVSPRRVEGLPFQKFTQEFPLAADPALDDGRTCSGRLVDRAATIPTTEPVGTVADSS